MTTLRELLDLMGIGDTYLVSIVDKNNQNILSVEGEAWRPEKYPDKLLSARVRNFYIDNNWQGRARIRIYLGK